MANKVALVTSEVACLLGYQDTASFYRAFHEWEGMPPNRWREMQARHVPTASPVH